MMTESPEEFRQRVERIDSKFFEDLEKRAGPYRGMAFEFEKLAVDYSNKGFQNVTYLNGGALVAIPTAMAFFKADVAKSDVLLTAAFFVAGLLFVVAAQVAAFFTMAKRAEGQNRLHLEQAHRIAALAFPHQTQANVENLTKADQEHTEANDRMQRSDVWRGAGLLFFSFSLFAFVLGCGWGAYTVMAAKERSGTAIDNLRK
ncbi:ABC-type transport system involved in cytochrome bd biosynthesis fused ATPase/permease subunit [Bradyrhizobium sp. GM0.4]